MATAEAKMASLRRVPAVENMPLASDVHKMYVDQKEVNEVRKFLGPDEVVEMTVRQRKLRPGGSMITPTSFIATNRRLMIINRTRLGIRKDYEVILYRNITAVKLAHGLFSCSVLIRVSNADTGDGQGQQEAIGGIRPKEAEALTHYLNKKIINAHQADMQDADDGVSEGESSPTILLFISSESAFASLLRSPSISPSSLPFLRSPLSLSYPSTRMKTDDDIMPCSSLTLVMSL